MAPDENVICHILYVCASEVQADAFDARHRSEFATLQRYTPDFSRADGRSSLKEAVAVHFGKRLPVVSPLSRFLKAVLWLLGLAETQKLGDPTRILIFDGGLFAGKEEFWSGLVEELRRLLEGYHSLFAVAYHESEVPKHRRQVYKIGIRIVLPLSFVPSDLDDQTFLVRSVEKDAFAERRKDLWGKLLTAGRGFALALLLLALGVVAKDLTANIRNWDPGWSCHLTRGDPTRKTDAEGSEWEEFILVISNDAGLPKQGFSITPPSGCETRLLPTAVSKRLTVGETVEIRFLVQAHPVGRGNRVITVRGPLRKPVCLPFLPKTAPPIESPVQPATQGAETRSPST